MHRIINAGRGLILAFSLNFTTPAFAATSLIHQQAPQPPCVEVTLEIWTTSGFDEVTYTVCSKEDLEKVDSMIRMIHAWGGVVLDARIEVVG